MLLHNYTPLQGQASCLPYMGMAVGEMVSRRVMFGVVIGEVGCSGVPIIAEVLL